MVIFLRSEKVGDEIKLRPLPEQYLDYKMTQPISDKDFLNVIDNNLRYGFSVGTIFATTHVKKEHNGSYYAQGIEVFRIPSRQEGKVFDTERSPRILERFNEYEAYIALREIRKGLLDGVTALKTGSSTFYGTLNKTILTANNALPVPDTAFRYGIVFFDLVDKKWKHFPSLSVKGTGYAGRTEM